jgi:5-methylcytosine-specific restriction protein B
MTDLPEQELVDEGALPPEDFHDCIDRTVEIAHHELELPEDLMARLETRTAGLLVDASLLREAAAALAVGHLVLQGPPGTGKSTLARILCEAFGVDYLPVTAHEEWSSFEVIGRHELRVAADGSEEIVGVNGFFTEAAIQCAGAFVRHSDDPTEPQATWLLIDELNRAEPDKAFGELFTVLGTDQPVAITLLHQRPGNNTLVTPRRFRLIATVNSVDKQFVNALSQGLRRRFTFLTMDVPPRKDPGEIWGNPAPGASLASREYSVAVRSAARRMALRLLRDGASPNGGSADELEATLNGGARPLVESVFEMAQLARYATADSGLPYVPIGTAPLVDTLELFLSLAWLKGMQAGDLPDCMDWAVSTKLVPLFEVDTTSRSQLLHLVEDLPPVLQQRARRELVRVASDGLHYVE